MTTDRENRLREIRERHAASTPGEWYVGRSRITSADTSPRIYYRHRGHEHSVARIAGVKFIEHGGSVESDAEFIAHAHQDVPFLLADIERLEKERNGWTEKAYELSDEIERLEAAIGEPMMDQIVNRSKPVGEWTFKPTICVKEGTDLSEIMDR